MLLDLNKQYTIKPEWILRNDLNYHSKYTMYNVNTNNLMVLSPALYSILKILYYNSVSLNELNNFVLRKCHLNLNLDHLRNIEEEHQVQLFCESNKPFHFYNQYYHSEDKILNTNIPLASTPIDVEIHFTHNCNLKCLHCFQNSSPISETKEDLLTVKEWVEIFRQFVYLNINNVIISGGEPLYYYAAKELLKVISTMPIAIYILTNGLLIDDEYLEIFKSKNINLNISLDGYRKETHEILRGKNTFIRTETNIKKLLQQKTYVTLSHTIHKQNYLEIELFIKYLIDLGVPEVAFGFVEALGRAELNKYLLLSIEDELNCLKLLKDVKHKYSSKIKIDFPSLSIIQNAPDYGNDDLVFCSAGTRRIAISSDGKLYPCISGIDNENLQVGDLKRDKIIDIWENEQLWVLLRGGINIKDIKTCSDCVLKNSCSFRNCRIKYYTSVDKMYAKPKNCMMDKAKMIGLEKLLSIV
jgi:radical SAM protein with 4Fe4S-binding SPASM domain